MIAVFIPYCDDLPALKQTLSHNLKNISTSFGVTVCDIASDPELKAYLDIHFPEVHVAVSPTQFNLYDWINICVATSAQPYAFILSPYVKLQSPLTALGAAFAVDFFALSPRFVGGVPPDLGVSKWVLGRYLFRNQQSPETQKLGRLNSLTEYASLVDVKKWQALNGFSKLFYPTENPMIDLCYRALKRGWKIAQVNTCEASLIPTYAPSFTDKQQRYNDAVTARLMRLKNNTTWQHHVLGAIATIWQLFTFKVLQNRAWVCTLIMYKGLKEARKTRLPDLVSDIDLNINF